MKNSAKQVCSECNGDKWIIVRAKNCAFMKCAGIKCENKEFIPI